MSKEADKRTALIFDNRNNTYKTKYLDNQNKENFEYDGEKFSLDYAKKFRKTERDWKKLGLTKTEEDFWIYLIEEDSDGTITPLDWSAIKEKMDYKKMSPFEMKQIVESDLERELEQGLKTPTEKLAGKKMFIIFAIVAIAVIVIYYSGVI